jgi:twitching motility protein PilT
MPADKDPETPLPVRPAQRTSAGDETSWADLLPADPARGTTQTRAEAPTAEAASAAPADLEAAGAPLPAQGAPAGAPLSGPSPRHQLELWIDQMVKSGASDLILRAGARPSCRVHGRIGFLPGRVPSSGALLEVLAGILGPERVAVLKQDGSVDAGLQLDGLGRFRLNAFRQLGEPALVLRRIAATPPKLEDLCLPTRELAQLALNKRGIILVTGIAGSGKSTTLAGMIEHMNRHTERHVITLEDPVEVLFIEERCVISQREVGTDVPNFHQGLRHALRQSPDVILIGEMRDAETVRAALDATETGHLVMSTVHTVNAAQTVDRVISFFPPEQHAQVRSRLADNIVGVLSQRLLPRSKGDGMVPAVELLVSTPRMRELVSAGRTTELGLSMEQGNEQGMLSFNRSLLRLLQAGLVDLDVAIAASDRPDELRLALRGYTGAGPGQARRQP